MYDVFVFYRYIIKYNSLSENFHWFEIPFYMRNLNFLAKTRLTRPRFLNFFGDCRWNSTKHLCLEGKETLRSVQNYLALFHVVRADEHLKISFVRWSGYCWWGPLVKAYGGNFYHNLPMYNQYYRYKESL